MCDKVVSLSNDDDVEIRKLNAKAIFDLSLILDVHQSWKKFMSNIKDLDSDRIKYNAEHINIVEKAAESQRRSPTEIVLEEWGTSGPRRPRISDLLNVLVETHLYRAADYVSLQLLKQERPLRPTSGPAAFVTLPGDFPSPSAPPLSLWDSECFKETIRLSQEKDQLTQSDIILHFGYQTLEDGTNNFSENNKVGSGGFGSVYLCYLNRRKLAVKRLHDSEQAVLGLAHEQFENEIKLLGGVAHKNILPIFGYSTDGPFKCIIYKYMANGSLQDALECKENRKVLSWQERLLISCGTSTGLEHLHTMEKPLVHRDLKSANILLDDDLNPKIGDFGLVRANRPTGKSFTLHTSTVIGTSAYMAPEAFKGEISPKGDVFSFGVVLLELMTGLSPYDEGRESYDLLTYVSDCEDINMLIDKRLEKPEESFIQGFYEVSEKCCSHNKKLRPTMTEVIFLLNKLNLK